MRGDFHPVAGSFGFISGAAEGYRPLRKKLLSLRADADGGTVTKLPDVSVSHSEKGGLQ